MADRKKAKAPELTQFQQGLLKNLIHGKEPLRHGHSAPVQELIELGLVKGEDGLFIPTASALKLGL